MTRAGQEPAQDVKRRLVAACREAGLNVALASARLVDGFDARVVHVEASRLGWSHELALISLMSMVGTNGDWPGTADLRSAPADDDYKSLNPPYNPFVLYMKGRKQVPIGDLVNEIQETITEREQVIAALKCGVAGPYTFVRSVWAIPFA